MAKYTANSTGNAAHSPHELLHSPRLNQQRLMHAHFSLTWMFSLELLSSFGHSSS
jgi:hypothetical protein